MTIVEQTHYDYKAGIDEGTALPRGLVGVLVMFLGGVTAHAEHDHADLRRIVLELCDDIRLFDGPNSRQTAQEALRYATLAVSRAHERVTVIENEEWDRVDAP